MSDRSGLSSLCSPSRAAATCRELVIHSAGAPSTPARRHLPPSLAWPDPPACSAPPSSLAPAYTNLRRDAPSPPLGARPVPPEKGVFPLDHLHDCDLEKKEYLACLKSTGAQSEKCRMFSKKYLKCRMDRTRQGDGGLQTCRRAEEGEEGAAAPAGSDAGDVGGEVRLDEGFRTVAARVLDGVGVGQGGLPELRCSGELRRLSG
ncbi:hypothetical protein ZWY2020_015199 [Hordeum vulgare]|nr:hypothetical protein ZWY2020_015199 [Hordeum vulgare]